MSNGIPDTMICNCGHVGDEHERTVAAPCTVEGCDCIAFDEAENQDAEREA